MKIPELMTVTPVVDVPALVNRIRLFLRELVAIIKDVKIPLTKELAKRMLEIVHHLRQLRMTHIRQIWNEIMGPDPEPEIM